MSQPDPDATPSSDLTPEELAQAAVNLEPLHSPEEEALASIRPLAVDFQARPGVPELEVTLAQTRALAQRYQQQNSDLESRTQSLAAAEQQRLQQVNRLHQELEQSQQGLHRAKIVNQSLSDQLKAAQDRIAELEQQWSLSQQRRLDQENQLRQWQRTCGDLQSRLQRQQRQTLQFKAALERCVELPGAAVCQPALSTPIQPWSQPGGLAPTSISPLLTEPPSHEIVSSAPAGPELPLSSLAQSEQAVAIPAWQPQGSGSDPRLQEMLPTPDSDVPPLAEDERPETPAIAEPLLPEPSPTSAWPAPLVYPERRQRTVKSLAAIHLPSFPRYAGPEQSPASGV